ncbi:MAG TPA: DUF1559 domain-containing protein, partial [Gemmataceae bacterium]|nr:DUF1559 domain-containing protein [Gemmataceae bacterium]
DEARAKELKKNVQIWKDEFQKAGGKDVYIIAKLADLRRPVAIIVPVEDTGKDKILAELFDKLWHDPEVKPLRSGKQLLIGSPIMIEALKHGHPTDRPQLAAAVTAVGDAPIQVVLLPSMEQRRVIEEMMPKLPKEMGGLPAKRITDGVQWLAVSAVLEPKVSVKVVIQSSDAKAAAGVQGLIGMGMLLLGKIPMADDKPLSEHLGADFNRIRKALTPEVENDRLVLQLNDELIFDFGAKLAVRVQEEAERKQHVNNLKQVVLAMHNYADTHGGHLPGRAGFGGKEAKLEFGKKPLLSWRVYLLPFVEQGNLFQQFHLDEPWDSEHNKKFIAQIPPVYQSDNAKLSMEGKTRIVGPVGKNMAFEPSGEGLIMPGDFPDGTANTIMLVEAAEANAVIWTKPDDLEIDLKDPKKGLIDPDAASFLTGFADGSAHRIPKKIDNKMLLYLFWRNDGNVINIPD